MFAVWHILFLIFLSFLLINGQDVKFCTGKNLGPPCFTQSLGTKQCLKLEKDNVITSLDTNGKCIRLYENDGCEGKSIAIVPNTSGRMNLESIGFKNIVSSFGPCDNLDRHCLMNEALRRRRAITTNNINTICVDANTWMTVGFLPWLWRDTTDLGNGPVRFYQRSRHNNRVEVMDASIQRHHLRTGSGTNNKVREYKKAMGFDNDDAGHLLANVLGGSGEDVRNIFPQNRKINRGDWRTKVESEVRKEVESKGSARYTVNLEYHEVEDTRPFRIVFRVIRESDGTILMMSSMPNPPAS